MAIFWVQQWWALPVILEEPRIGDAQREGGRLPFGRIISSTAGTQGVMDDNEQPGASGSGAFHALGFLYRLSIG